MTKYIWQAQTWPKLTWDSDTILQPLAQVRKQQGILLGKLAGFNFNENIFVSAKTFEEDVVQTAAIEGESLDREGVRSSIAIQLNLPYAGLRLADRATDGLVQVLLNATFNYQQPLTEERLFGWHSALFPTNYSGLQKIKVAGWRGTPMAVVSGPLGKQNIHYEAPAPEYLPREMQQYFTWWTESLNVLDGIIRAALAHLYFVTIHPFEDGNGRLARSLTDLALAQDENIGMRFYSLSAQIMKERSTYYTILEATQKGTGDCTDWILWFFSCLGRAIVAADNILEVVQLKANFWKQNANIVLNLRQKKILNRLLDAGVTGFVGGLTTRKYVGMTKTSRTTAWREIEDMLQKGLLKSLPGGGRSTAYVIDYGLGDTTTTI